MGIFFYLRTKNRLNFFLIVSKKRSFYYLSYKFFRGDGLNLGIQVFRGPVFYFLSFVMKKTKSTRFPAFCPENNFFLESLRKSKKRIVCLIIPVFSYICFWPYKNGT